MENRNIDRLIEIASLLKSKDLSCFDEFYENTKTKTYNIIYALVRNQTITEDLLQDTYVKFLNNLESLKEDVNPVGYLTTIARNTALDYLKRNHREVYVDAYDNVDIYGGESDKYNLDINVFKIAKELLRPKEFEIVYLHLIEDLKFEDISKHINKPLGTVLWSYNNSIKKLRKEMKKYGIE